MATNTACADAAPIAVETLRQHLSYEVVRAFGFNHDGPLRGPIDWIFRVPTRRFAETGVRFDSWVRRLGFAAAASRALELFTSGYDAVGREHIPREGPLLITSNHPGVFDILLIAASVGRDDIKIVAGDIPFLMNLPCARGNLIFASKDPHQRMGVLRAAMRHLRDGGALAIFPSGHIDPDPAILPGAYDALEEWSRSVELMLRRVPDTRVLVTIVSGVLARACTRNPLTRLRKLPRDRQRVAEFLQVAQQMVLERSFSLSPNVSFAKPLTLQDLGNGRGTSGATGVLVDHAQTLLSQHTARVLA